MRTTALVLAGLFSLSLAACNHPLPPATPVPPAPTATGYGPLPPQTDSIDAAGGAAQRFLIGMDVPGQWWTLFHSDQLNVLIAEAMDHNPDVSAAQAALRSARELYQAQRSSAYPSAQGSFGVTRQQSPAFYSPPLNGPDYAYTVHTASVDVAYTPDVFGNLRYQTASAAAAAQEQRLAAEATYLTLTSSVVATVIEIASLHAQIDATNRIVALDTNVLALTEAQRKQGQLTNLDVDTQEAVVLAAQQTLPGLQKQLSEQRDLLARLVGRAPGDTPDDAPFDLASLHLPEDLPLSLPSQLIVQRPDIAQTTANLQQAGAEVGVAYTNRLPNFAITAQTATQALALGGLFGAGSLLSVLTAQVTTTFYDHGTLKHRETAAVAAYDQAAAQYTGAILSGLQNVADTLAALTTDAAALRAAVLSERAAERALQLTRTQRRYGQVSGVATLNAEQTYQQARLTLVQAQASRFSDTAALFAALGGGWWNRNDTANS
jgi:NodT family efflux transporter outer membrane factor (OMF) lipoprotein